MDQVGLVPISEGSAAGFVSGYIVYAESRWMKGAIVIGHGRDAGTLGT